MEQTKEKFIEIMKPLVKKYASEINKNEYRNLILEVLREYGANGVKIVREHFTDSKIDIHPFDMAIIKIIAELTSFAQ